MIGGYGSPWGAIAGALGVWWLQEALRFPWTDDGSVWFLDQQDRYWILGLVLVLSVIFRQEGIILRRPLKLGEREVEPVVRSPGSGPAIQG